MKNVEWRPIPGFEDAYEVSRDGRVRSVERPLSYDQRRRTAPGRELRLVLHSRGYLQVLLWRDNRPTKRFVHRLVCEAFHGPPPAGQQCCHYDGDKQNNRAENLRWDTGDRNRADSERHGVKFGPAAPARGRDHARPSRRLSEGQVREIRALSGQISQSELAGRYGVVQQTISDIVNRKRWAWLD